MLKIESLFCLVVYCAASAMVLKILGAERKPNGSTTSICNTPFHSIPRNKCRMILDLSHPENISVNDGITVLGMHWDIAKC